MRGSYQRRHGQEAVIFRSYTITDERGNKVKMVDMANPHLVRAVFIPQRSSRAELPGQQDLDIMRMLVDAKLEGVDSWSRVYWEGVYWDVVVPPARRGFANRHLRHWTIDLRRRP